MLSYEPIADSRSAPCFRRSLDGHPSYLVVVNTAKENREVNLYLGANLPLPNEATVVLRSSTVNANETKSGLVDPLSRFCCCLAHLYLKGVGAGKPRERGKAGICFSTFWRFIDTFIVVDLHIIFACINVVLFFSFSLSSSSHASPWQV